MSLNTLEDALLQVQQGFVVSLSQKKHNLS